MDGDCSFAGSACGRDEVVFIWLTFLGLVVVVVSASIRCDSILIVT